MFMDWKISIVKMQYWPFQVSTDTAYSLSKAQLLFWVDINKLIIKFIWKCKAPRTAKYSKKEKKADSNLEFHNLLPHYGNEHC